MTLTLVLSTLTLSVFRVAAVPFESSSASTLYGNSTAHALDPFVILIPMATTSIPPMINNPTLIIVTDTVTATETTTIQVPSTTTEANTLSTTTATETSTSSTATTTSMLTGFPVPTPTTWAAPAQMANLDAFNVTSFSSGRANLLIANGVPVSAMGSSPAPADQATFIRNNSFIPQTGNNETSVLQIFYPANSINPARKPEGGAQFYATPLDLSSAQNVSLEYSVFFPEGFIWVKGGKLPGLYGGHTSCSGGADALTCFSTRLMWRQDGAGELYLYAPKAKQTEALCSDPQSVCDAAYGFSVGRGSFNYTAGGWTKVRQNIVLNTPGHQDGVFTLDVDGKRVINRTDIFYRDVAILPSSEAVARSSSRKISFGHGGQHKIPHLLQRRNPKADAGWSGLESSRTTPTSSTATGKLTTDLPEVNMLDSSSQGKLVGFTGLFFSTFFGGHEDDYATPKDQYTWFKGFSITRYA